MGHKCAVVDCGQLRASGLNSAARVALEPGKRQQARADSDSARERGDVDLCIAESSGMGAYVRERVEMSLNAIMK